MAGLLVVGMVALVMLYLFDMDGTLIRTFLDKGTVLDYDDVEILPGRVEKLRALAAEGHSVALVTNQGGMAFGYQTSEQVNRKLNKVCQELEIFGTDGWSTSAYTLAWTPVDTPGRSTVYASFGHPDATVNRWGGHHAAHPDWRKPGGGMIKHAMAGYGVTPEETVFVGDMESDRKAAEAAGVAYVDAEEFFA